MKNHDLVNGCDPNTPLRMHIALKVLRAWNHGTEGYSADVVLTINEWIDGGMKGPIPWPDNPFFTEWAKGRGYSSINGYIGFVLKMETEKS